MIDAVRPEQPANAAGAAGRLTRAGSRARRRLVLTGAAFLTLAAAAAAVWWLAGQSRPAGGDGGRKAAEPDRKSVEEGERARAWLAPLARQPGALAEPEAAALRQAAAHSGDPLAQRFVREAVTDPGMAPVLAARADYVWQAALGLDRKQRDEAERLLLAELRSEKDPKRRADLALAMGALGGLSAEAARPAAEALARAMDATSDPWALRRLAESLAEAATRLEPAEAAATCAPAAGVLVRAMTEAKDGEQRRALAAGLSALAPRLTPKDAADSLARALAIPSVQLDEPAFRELAPALSAVAPRLSPADALATFDALAGSVRRAVLDVNLQSLAECMAAVAARLGPKEAAEIASRLVQGVIQPTNDLDVPKYFARGLMVVAPRLAPDGAAAVADALAGAITGGAVDWLQQQYAAEALAAAAGRMRPQEARAVCRRVADALVNRITGTNRFLEDTETGWDPLAYCLLVVSARLEPKDAAALAVRAMTAGNGPDLRQLGLAGCVEAASVRLGPTDAAEAARTLSLAMSKEQDSYRFRFEAPALAALADRLGPEEAAAVCGPAAAAVGKAMPEWEQFPHDLSAQASGLAALARRLPPKEAAAACGPAAAVLVRVMTGPVLDSYLPELADALSAVAAGLEPEEAATDARLLARALAATPKYDRKNLRPLARGLTALASRMQAKDGAATCESAAAVAARAMTENIDAESLGPMAQGLAALTAGMGPQAAAALRGPAAAVLVEHMTRSKALGEDLRPLAEGLTALAPGLGPKEAAPLAQALARPDDWQAVEFLGRGLSDLAPDLGPKEAAKAAAALADAMSKTTPEWQLREQAQGLSALAARMEPKEAAAASARAADVLVRALDGATISRDAELLADGLAVLTARMEPRDAAAACGPAAATLLRAISRLTDQDQEEKEVLLRSLSSVLARENPDASPLRLAAAAFTAGRLDGTAAVGRLWPSLEPLPPPFPAQTLVDLLKDPLCVGEARRLVLGQLARHYGRPFTDQWDFARFAGDQNLGLDLAGPGPR